MKLGVLGPDWEIPVAIPQRLKVIKCSVQFKDTRLEEAVTFFSEYTNLNIVADPRHDIDMKVLVTYAAEKTSVLIALQAILEQQGAYMIATREGLVELRRR